MGDNDIIKLGDSADLQIYHNGTDSIISDTGTGNLALLTNGTLVGMYTNAGETMFTASKDGGVNLWYDNSAKIVTTATGVSVTGSIGLTGTVDGRDVASDGSKLDGIESGATADQTASEILTLIKTVDGSGSGLDADTLDGVNSGSFLRSDAADTKTSGDLSFSDNVKANFGASSDLQIYHDGSNSYIDETFASGSLYIRGNNTIIQKYTGETMIQCVADGKVELNFDNVPKLATKSDGVDITGELQADSLDIDGAANISSTLTMSGGNIDFVDGVEARFGTGNDLRIYHDGTHSYINDAGTGSIYVLAQDFYMRNSANTAGMIYATAGGAVSLYYNGGFKLSTASDGINVSGNINGATDIFVEDQIIHTGDTDTYTQFHAANQWRVVTGGTEMLEVNDSYVLLGANSVGNVQTATSVTGTSLADLYTYNSFVWTLVGNITLSNPTTEAGGMSGVFIFIQDGTGGRTVSLGTDWETAGGAGLTLSSASGAVDIVPYYVQASGNILLGTPQLAFA